MIREILKILASLMLSVLVVSQASAQNEVDYVEDARHYMDKGEYRSAVIQLKNALQRDPEDGTARLMLGESYLATGDPLSAEKELTRAAELGIPERQWRLLMGEVYLKTGRAEQLLTELEVDEDTEDGLRAEILSLRGRAYLGEGRQEEARTAFAQALEADPDNVAALLGEARIELMMENRVRASELAQRALALDPSAADAWLLDAELRRLEGDMQGALESFQRALESDPESVGARLGRAATYVALERYEDASADLDRILQRAPNYPLANYLAGLLAYREGDLEGAVPPLQLALNYAPNHAPSELLLGTIFYRQGNLNQAVKHLEKYLSLVPDQAAGIKLLAAAYLKTRQPDRAVHLLEQVVPHIPDDPQILALLGTAHLQAGDSSKAMEYLGRASEIAPDAAAIRAQLAIGHLASGEADAAASELQSAVDLGQNLVQADVLLILTRIRAGEPDQALEAVEVLRGKLKNNPIPDNLAGAAYLAKRDYAAARQAFERALKIRPDFTAAKMNLGHLDEVEGNLEGARDLYKEVLSHDGGHEKALLGLARIDLQQGKADQAGKWLEQAWEANNHSGTAAAALVNYYLRREMPLKALDVARTLQQKYPNNPVALRVLAAAQLAAKTDASAVATLKTLVELAPEDPQALLLLAQAHIQRGDLGLARDSLKRLLALRPDAAEAKVLLAKIAIRDRSYDSALEFARELQQSEATAPIGYELEGEALVAKGDLEGSIAAYEEAYRRQPTTERVVRRFQILRGTDRPEDATAVLDEWLDRRPDDVRVRTLAAENHQSLGHLDTARKHYEILLESDENNVVALNNLAWVLHSQQDAGGLEYARRAHELAPDRPEVTDTYGWLLVQEGEVNKGLVLLQEALVKAPHISEIRYHTAIALEKAGRPEEARRELERIMRTDRDFAHYDAVVELHGQLAR
jgi:putative PEP-CTERM system TPR-repeat lipoprotein